MKRFTHEQLTEAIEVFSDPRFQIRTIASENQTVVPASIAEVCVEVLKAVRDGELVELPEDGLHCNVPAHKRAFLAGDGRWITEDVDDEVSAGVSFDGE